MATGERISAIIPSYREGRRLLESVRAARLALGDCELIVVAFGECAELRDAARAEGAIWIEATQANRGHQLHLGARQARSAQFVFVHADSRLPLAAGDAIRCALGTPGVAGGAFRLRFDIQHPVLALLGVLSAATLTTAFLGDQCLFCSRAAYECAGGFRADPLFEDVGFAQRLAKAGRLVRLPMSVTTSGRRFQRNGFVQQLVRNALLMLAYHMGASPRQLHTLYEGQSRAGSPERTRHRRGAGRRGRRRTQGGRTC